ncbi:MAG TPA: 2-C-methyl-D-erythritol 4-phosphate cytidylyltransferase [Pseudonocardiaceae bacterium]|nr:2-C-methyl-D-erythritol 4-phosphate cytidylyltransferase [Pseudonocardiaceae bacterium]
MSDASVVALVPAAGQAEQDLADGVVQRLGQVAGRVVTLASGSSSLAEAAVAAVVSGVRVVLVHDPLRGELLPDVAARVVRAVLATGRPVVPVLPCSDTVKRVDDSSVVIDTPDRDELRVVRSPIGYPAELVTSGAVTAGTVPTGAVTIDGGPA